MAQRIYRELSDPVKKSISDAMKEFHSKRTIDSKLKTAQKQSDSLKRYWSNIRSREENEDNQ